MTPALHGRFLYFSPASYGGLADYAHEQASALVEQGLELLMLVTPDFARQRPANYPIAALLREPERAQSAGGQLSRKLRNVRCLLHNQAVLARTIRQRKCRWVMFGSYLEYLAPLWAWPLRQLARSGVVFGSVVHDPVRDFQVGPAWWHRRCVAAGYSFVREAFVHEAITLDTARPMPGLRTTVIPHGPFRFPPARHTRAALRRQLGLPAEARVILAFGHIRDAKNLDLLLEALVACPDLHLVVAGQEQSSGQKPAASYRQMAGRLGVADRCRWVLGHVAPGEVGDLFVASDLVALTYSRAFRSASGVLNVAVQFRRPCLASSGEGNLKSKVLQYGLGIWVEPDAATALVRGLQEWLTVPPTPRWEDYERENSWARNAVQVIEAMGGGGRPFC